MSAGIKFQNSDTYGNYRGATRVITAKNVEILFRCKNNIISHFDGGKKALPTDYMKSIYVYLLKADMSSHSAMMHIILWYTCLLKLLTAPLIDVTPLYSDDVDGDNAMVLLDSMTTA